MPTKAILLLIVAVPMAYGQAPCSMTELMGVQTNPGGAVAGVMAVMASNPTCGGCLMKCATAADATSCAMGCASAPAAANTAAQNVVELAVATADLSTLVAAVTAADLGGALSGAGPFTVFAPTNAAFDAVPKADLDDLLKPENKEKLQGVLQYHVISGSIMAGDLKDSQVVKTLSGQEVTIVKRDGGVYVNDAKVVAADVIGSNGVVHIVDKVIRPPVAATSKVPSNSSLTQTSLLFAMAGLLMVLFVHH